MIASVILLTYTATSRKFGISIMPFKLLITLLSNNPKFPLPIVLQLIIAHIITINILNLALCNTDQSIKYEYGWLSFHHICCLLILVCKLRKYL